MPEQPTFDAFLADPAGQWRAASGAIPRDWATQAARSSRAFREVLQDEVAAALAAAPTLEPVAAQCAILAEVFDAQDIALLFRRLSAVRPPAEWAAEFGRRFRG